MNYININEPPTLEGQFECLMLDGSFRLLYHVIEDDWYEFKRQVVYWHHWFETEKDIENWEPLVDDDKPTHYLV